MALDHLLAVLHTEAEAEVERVLATARQEAEAIRQRCEADLAERRRRDQQALDTERRTEVEFALVAARRQARRDELEARDRMLARVLDTARSRFGSLLPTATLRAALGAQVAQSLDCLATRAATIQAHPDLTGLVVQAVGNRSGVKVVADPGAGTGFRVASDDGTLAIDGTLEGRLVRMNRQLRQDILRQWERAP